MTTWADLQPLLRGPALTIGIDLVMEGDDDDPNKKRTGKLATAYRWIHFSTSIPGSDYLTFAAPNNRFVSGLVEGTIFGEPVGGSKGMYDIADALEASYFGKDTEALTFRLELATMPQDLFVENDWLRLDWRLPFSWFKNA